MATPRLVPFLRGGKTEDDIKDLRGPFAEALANLIENAPDHVKQTLGIVSAYRSPERQKELFDAAVEKYGSEEAARKWVAPPGRSKHNHGEAVDLGFGEKGTPAYEAAKAYAHANASQYGLNFPMGHEPWHVEPSKGFGGLPAQTGVAAANIPVQMPDLSPVAARQASGDVVDQIDLGLGSALKAFAGAFNPPQAPSAAPTLQQPQRPIRQQTRQATAVARGTQEPQKVDLSRIFAV